MSDPQMRIAFLGSARYPQPLDPTSRKKFLALSALGDLFVIGFAHRGGPRVFTEHARFYLLPASPVAVIRYAELLLFGPIVALWLIFRRRVEIIVAQSPYEGAAGAVAKGVAGLLGRRIGLVVESHGDFEESLFLQRRLVAPRLYRFVMRRAAIMGLKHADVLRVISSSTRQQLQPWAAGKPIVQFPTWTDIDEFRRQGMSGEDRRFEYIVSAGVLIPGKGFHHLLGAFRRIADDFPSTRVAIVGRAENSGYAAELRARVKDLGLTARVQFVGEVSQAELARWMRAACMFVLPTLSEGLGRVVFEAMATGCPVIASAVGGIPDMIDDGRTGLLAPAGDEIALAERLRWILDHPGEASEMGRRGRVFAERFHSTDAYVRGYASVIGKIRTRLPPW